MGLVSCLKALVNLPRVESLLDSGFTIVHEDDSFSSLILEGSAHLLVLCCQDVPQACRSHAGRRKRWLHSRRKARENRMRARAQVGGGASRQQPRDHHRRDQPQAGRVHLRLQELHCAGDTSQWTCSISDEAISHEAAVTGSSHTCDAPVCSELKHTAGQQRR